MSSPFRSSDPSRSSPRSSPSRQSLHRSGNGNGRTNGYHRTRRESPADSPSRQLWEELNRLMLDGDKAFKHELDSRAAEQETLHRQALDQALQEHEKVRQSAERAREQLQIEIELENRRREEDQKRKLEEARHKLAEEDAARQRRELEEAKRREEERRQQEVLKRQKEEQERHFEAQRRSEEDEAAQRKAAQEKQEAERKAREAAREDAAAKARQGQAPQSLPLSHQTAQQTNGTTPAASSAAPQSQSAANESAPTARQPLAALPSASAGASASASANAAPGLFSSLEQREAVHNQYISLHKHLKKMRSNVEDECKKRSPKLKEQLSDMRRAVNKNMGQLNKHDKRANLAKAQSIRAILDQAIGMSDISVDPSEFIICPDQPPISNDANKQYPGPLLYLLSRFAKSAIAQLTQEAGVDTSMADGIGVLLVTVFSVSDYRWNGQSLIDVLWAKYHVVCPALFGIYGDQNTPTGRKRIGWWAEGGGFIKEASHYQRMIGLGAGFSAITLRDFTRSRNANPAPNRLWWEAMARILNLPPGQPQRTHYVLVQALVKDHVPRIMQIFGFAGKAVLKKAIYDFPQHGPKSERGEIISEASAVEALHLVLQQQYDLTF